MPPKNPPPEAAPVSVNTPSLCTPSGLTANTSACRLSLYVPRNNWMLSSWDIRSRSANVARTEPAGANARTPTWSAVAEYHTNTSVLSCAAIPSEGKNCENPVNTAALLHSTSLSFPSTVPASSRRGVATVNWPRRPSKTGPARWPPDVALTTGPWPLTESTTGEGTS